MIGSPKRELAAFTFLLSAGLALAQEVPAMKMVTEIPEVLTTPDNIQNTNVFTFGPTIRFPISGR